MILIKVGEHVNEMMAVAAHLFQNFLWSGFLIIRQLWSDSCNCHCSRRRRRARALGNLTEILEDSQRRRRYFFERQGCERRAFYFFIMSVVGIHSPSTERIMWTRER